ncbi:MAG: hypothetical protein Q8Q63_10430 [Phaeovulum sp.]|uniref:hypothetical protein n=1 Tax=Phaeovulum sp. TaxID=2934796 RepID=UPI00273669B1|nr:hypothetical protein [Phaeovulum sp.]MDP3861984.1 hypothetical protein [Phaeovulum sp.]
MFKPILGLVMASLLTGCATSSNEVAPQYISPTMYQNFSCRQIAEEAQRVSARTAQLSGVQDAKAQGDAVATGVALVLFWPALFFIQGDKQNAAELSRLKGEFQALEQASIQKNCGIEFRAATTPAS